VGAGVDSFFWRFINLVWIDTYNLTYGADEYVTSIELLSPGCAKHAEQRCNLD